MNDQTNALNQFLIEIEELRNKLTKNEEYNAYQIFRLNDKEVMHSRFIKSLLNPNEKHGYKKEFLELFLKQVGITEFSINGVTTECEKNTHNNRYIDIAIENKISNQMIVIENKIWAKDLPNQLYDYYHYALTLYKEPKNIYILYLTPYGKQPESISFPNIIEQPFNGIKCISYEKDIILWLEACLEHIAVKDKSSRLYHAIEMYIELIYKTINRDKYMEKIFEKLLNCPTQMETAIDIVKALVGKQYFKFGTISREKVIKNIQIAIDNLGYEIDNPYEDGDAEVIKIFDDYYLRLDEDCIYGENYDFNLANTLEINGNDLNDVNLVALLSNNQVVIQKWINETISYLKGEVKNL